MTCDHDMIFSKKIIDKLAYMPPESTEAFKHQVSPTNMSNYKATNY